MEELLSLLEQLIEMLEQSFDGYDQLWNVRGEIDKLTYLAGMECVPLTSDWSEYNNKCEKSIEVLRRDTATPTEYMTALKNIKMTLESYKSSYDYYAELNEREMSWSRINENQYMRQTTRRLSDEYDKFMNDIENGRNFALIRCGDGEYSLMNGLQVHAQENWFAPSRMTRLGKAIRESIEYSSGNYYYGISCPCCDPKAYFWYTKNVGNINNITFANLWVNCNYRKFTNDFPKLKRDAILIANYRAKDKPIGNLNILKHYPVSDDCVGFWEEEGDRFIESIINDFGNRNDLLYVVAAGPMSCPIIQKLHENNPNNCYVDFGSCIDPWFHETISRPYMIPGTIYAERNCFIHDPAITPYPKITAVMTLYKRPDALLKQLEAIENQSIPPEEIILFQDAIQGGVYRIELEEEIKKRFTKVKIAETNQGVWGRFKYAYEVAAGDYVCVFDDDTIPGNRWFENCFMHMVQKEAIYGTVGIGMFDYTGYPVSEDDIKYWRFGWPNPVSHCMEVDFVGHSWFVKKEHLGNMIDGSEDFSTRHKYEGEDAYISYANAKKGIRTIVPTHYSCNTGFWGSTSKAFGTEKFALSLNAENLKNMGQAISELVDKGWDTLQFRSPEYLAEHVINKNR